MNDQELKERFGKSKHGNFEVTNITWMPHPLLVVTCSARISDADHNIDPELKQYLLGINGKAAKSGFVGYAFIEPKES